MGKFLFGCLAIAILLWLFVVVLEALDVGSRKRNRYTKQAGVEPDKPWPRK